MPTRHVVSPPDVLVRSREVGSDSAAARNAPAAPMPLDQRTFGERLNFLLTNRIPRRAATRFMGWFSRIRNPLLARVSIAAWQLFVDDLRLHESSQQRFESLQDCFTRTLCPGARNIDPDPEVLVSPCDAVIGEFGHVRRQHVIQAKGFPYALPELLANDALAGDLEGACFVTLRLKSSMYHHFHAPCGGRLQDVTYVSGDTWNVNPPALKSIERLYCRNERAVVRMEPDHSTQPVVLVAIAAILVASLRLVGVDAPLDLRYRGPNRIGLARRVGKGDRLGHFEHGSTIVLFAGGDLGFDERVCTGQVVRLGEPLLRHRATEPLRYSNRIDIDS